MTAETDRIGLRDLELLRTAAYIGGVWVESDQRLAVENPATGGCIAMVAAIDADGARAAVAAAEAALPAWRDRTAAERAIILRRWHDLMMEHRRDLARLMAAEQGKPVAEADGEVGYAAGFLAWFAEEARRVYGDVIPGHQPGVRLHVLKRAVGVVAAITPWNFPYAMITRKAGAALAAGCTIVVKPSELTPLSALALAELAERAGVPAGVFNVVIGEPVGIGDVLVEDARVAKLSFTGSTAVGKKLAARCMDTVKRVSLELGGNAPFIIFDDADLDAAVRGAIASKFRNAGQTCVCANRLLAQSGVAHAFAERLAVAVREMTMGDALAGEAQLGPLINGAAVAKAKAHVDDALAGGATLMTGGEAPERPGNFFAPTVLAGVRADALLCREETFGPVAGIVPFADEGEAIALANATRAGLAAYVYTRDLARSHRVTEALEYGMVGLNTGLISTEVAPFGGIKESGIGREGSRYGIDDYVDLKLVCTSIL
jgi:succinate-semialdehyde dehydrogenase / glutarate-semialdehyde dehydrogenase